MVRRLLAHVLDGYGADARITELVDTTELWFVPVANPDGYDLTFEPNRRLWRKNVRDNNGNGQINTGDGVDLNRNWPTRWGYDNEGSSPTPSSDTYRGPGSRLGTGDAGSRLAVRAGSRRSSSSTTTRPPSSCCTASAGRWRPRRPTTCSTRRWRATTPTRPCPVTTRTSLPSCTRRTGTPTPTCRRSTGRSGSRRRCRRARRHRQSDPDDEWEAEDCGSGFEFPNDEVLVQAEFEKNIPFALAVAESAQDPDDPVSVVGSDRRELPARHVRRVLGRSADRRRDGEAGGPQRAAWSTASTAGATQRASAPRSGPAASATASRTTTTTPSCAPRSREPTWATRSRCGSRGPSPAAARCRVIRSPTPWSRRPATTS